MLVFCDHSRLRADIVCCQFELIIAGCWMSNWISPFLTLTDPKQIQCTIHSFFYKHTVMISWMTNKKLCKQLTERTYCVFHAGEYWRSGWQFKSFHIEKQQKAQNNKTSNKATKAHLTKPCRQSICSLSWVEHWIGWFLVPEQIAEKQHSLKRAVSPACRAINDRLSQVWDFSIQVMCLYWELSAQYTPLCTKAQRGNEEASAEYKTTEEFVTNWALC